MPRDWRPDLDDVLENFIGGFLAAVLFWLLMRYVGQRWQLPSERG